MAPILALGVADDAQRWLEAARGGMRVTSSNGGMTVWRRMWMTRVKVRVRVDVVVDANDEVVAIEKPLAVGSRPDA